jgi:hypothetical protein
MVSVLLLGGLTARRLSQCYVLREARPYGRGIASDG